MLEIKVTKEYIKTLRKKNLEKPFLILVINNKKKVIHSIEFFLKILIEKNILKIIFNEDYIYLISFRKVFLYEYGKYFFNMEKI